MFLAVFSELRCVLSLSNFHFCHSVTHPSSYVQKLSLILSPFVCFESHVSQRCNDTPQNHFSPNPPTYTDGSPNKPRVANTGYDCYFDTAHGLWGFCPTPVTASSGCSLVGFCFDSVACTTGWGTETLRAVTNYVDTFTTTSQSFSFLASLITSPVSPAESPNPSASTSFSLSFHSSNIGAISGGAVAAIVVICLTVLGVLLIRWKGCKGGKAASKNDSGHSMQGLVGGKKSGEQVKSRYEAVEM
ncbi:hypothetical protein COCMIDRAFT_35270 [Bipolaris oryzae ATCC 44560]|uniref:Uncharacterized protein n=1 Tax=Bipolaris oryzae ATCC 44560 TaxID=930090 RepID=W6ZI65_COCMI|nr:uncharacterized protein COCMIDRAFT_35270 [Bipolaris oryzae ATCC 44560]EUC47119.1 hypothetical protein COCMIDRAFT_35270 [Bipolaris oryzae ATCC 44560]